MDDAPPRVELADEIRAVASFAAASAATLLPAFEVESPSDKRPREAPAAAWEFARGGPRSRRQRVTALDAYRAAAEADIEACVLVARVCGDAAAAVYPHPIARATQVGHILRVAACAVRSAERAAGGDPAAAEATIGNICRDIDPVVVAVLRRHPPMPPGTSRLARVTGRLDAALRQP